jgi:dolichol kinase
MIPTVIVVGLLAGLFAPRWFALAGVFIVGLGWATLVATTNGADFAGGFAFGAANAAVGVVLGAGVRALVAPRHNIRPPRETR